MFKRRNALPARIDTLLGGTTKVEGNVEFAGALHLDGHVSGNVRAATQMSSTLSISPGGRVDGAVEVTHILLNGVVQGDIRASGRVVLGARARVYGNVHYGVIEVALGAEVRGKLVPHARLGGTSAAPTVPKVA